MYTVLDVDGATVLGSGLTQEAAVADVVAKHSATFDAYNEAGITAQDAVENLLANDDLQMLHDGQVIDYLLS